MAAHAHARRRLLYLVRHAAVSVVPARPAATWTLSKAGRADADALAAAFAGLSLSLVVSSPEPKALATASPIAAAAGLDVRVEAELREVERGRPVVGRDDYRRAVARYLAADVAPAGWEPRWEAAARICRCVERVVNETPGSVCIVSHGIVLTLFLAAVRGRAPDASEWAAVPLPAVGVLDAASLTELTGLVSLEEFLA